MATLYEAAGGIDGLTRLAEAWHGRVVADEVVGHAFSHGFAAHHTDRLAAYWAEALGGPELFTGTYGDETAVVRIHSGNGEHEEMNHRAADSSGENHATPQRAAALDCRRYAADSSA